MHSAVVQHSASSHFATTSSSSPLSSETSAFTVSGLTRNVGAASSAFVVANLHNSVIQPSTTTIAGNNSGQNEAATKTYFCSPNCTLYVYYEGECVEPIEDHFKKSLASVSALPNKRGPEPSSFPPSFWNPNQTPKQQFRIPNPPPVAQLAPQLSSDLCYMPSYVDSQCSSVPTILRSVGSGPSGSVWSSYVPTSASPNPGDLYNSISAYSRLNSGPTQSYGILGLPPPPPPSHPGTSKLQSPQPLKQPEWPGLYSNAGFGVAAATCAPLPPPYGFSGSILRSDVRENTAVLPAEPQKDFYWF